VQQKSVIKTRQLVSNQRRDKIKLRPDKSADESGHIARFIDERASQRDVTGCKT
jgi:hypothetical protein